MKLIVNIQENTLMQNLNCLFNGFGSLVTHFGTLVKQGTLVTRYGMLWLYIRSIYTKLPNLPSTSLKYLGNSNLPNYQSSNNK